MFTADWFFLSLLVKWARNRFVRELSEANQEVDANKSPNIIIEHDGKIQPKLVDTLKHKCKCLHISIFRKRKRAKKGTSVEEGSEKNAQHLRA